MLAFLQEFMRIFILYYCTYLLFLQLMGEIERVLDQPYDLLADKLTKLVLEFRAFSGIQHATLQDMEIHLRSKVARSEFITMVSISLSISRELKFLMSCSKVKKS